MSVRRRQIQARVKRDKQNAAAKAHQDKLFEIIQEIIDEMTAEGKGNNPYTMDSEAFMKYHNEMREEFERRLAAKRKLYGHTDS